MLSGFVVQAIVEVLVYYRVPFPKGVEFFFAWIGFLIQALIMSNHLNGDPGLEKEVCDHDKNTLYRKLFLIRRKTIRDT
jgi:hypothetical protein